MYNQYGSSSQPTADELAIANMLTALGTPQICKHFSEEEQSMILAAIKKHILLNASIVNKNDFNNKLR